MEPATAIITNIRKDIEQLADRAAAAVLRAKEARLIGDRLVPSEIEERNKHRIAARNLVARYLSAMKTIGWSDAQVSEHKVSLRDSVVQAKAGPTEPAREVYAAALDQLGASA